MTVLNETRPSVSTFTNEDKSSVAASSISSEAKSGRGWHYDDISLTYDGALDPESGMEVLYDSIGIAPVITNEAKNSV